MTSQPEFKTRRSRYAGVITEDLTQILSAVVPEANAQDLQDSIRTNIMEPAIYLAHDLQVATSVFSVTWPSVDASSDLRRKDLAALRCVDLTASGITLDLSAAAQKDQSKQPVTYLFDISPGLDVKTVESGDISAPRVLYKPTVLVFTGLNGPKKRPTILKWLCDGVKKPQDPPKRELRRGCYVVNQC
jgi:hypothetical protein